MAAVQLVVLRMRVGRRMSSGALCGTTQPYKVNAPSLRVMQLRNSVRIFNRSVVKFKSEISQKPHWDDATARSTANSCVLSRQVP